MDIQRTRKWLAARSDMWLDVVRIYLGVGLFVKGLSFVTMRETSVLATAQLGWLEGLAAHYVVPVHIVGGLMLAVGLATRVAAIFNIPILLGAVLFVHAKDGLFSRGQSLELAMLVLVLLMVFAIAGSGRLSVDRYLEKHSSNWPERRPSLA